MEKINYWVGGNTLVDIVFVYLCLSICLFICLTFRLHIYIYFTFLLSVYLSIDWSKLLCLLSFLSLSIYQSVCLSFSIYCIASIDLNKSNVYVLKYLPALLSTSSSLSIDLYTNTKSSLNLQGSIYRFPRPVFTNLQ